MRSLELKVSYEPLYVLRHHRHRVRLCWGVCLSRPTKVHSDAAVAIGKCGQLEPGPHVSAGPSPGEPEDRLPVAVLLEIHREPLVHLRKWHLLDRYRALARDVWAKCCRVVSWAWRSSDWQ